MLKCGEINGTRNIAFNFSGCFSILILYKEASLNYWAAFYLCFRCSSIIWLRGILNYSLPFFLIEITLMYLECLKLGIECHYFIESNDVFSIFSILFFLYGSWLLTAVNYQTSILFAVIFCDNWLIIAWVQTILLREHKRRWINDCWQPWLRGYVAWVVNEMPWILWGNHSFIKFQFIFNAAHCFNKCQMILCLRNELFAWWIWTYIQFNRLSSIIYLRRSRAVWFIQIHIMQVIAQYLIIARIIIIG